MDRFYLLDLWNKSVETFNTVDDLMTRLWGAYIPAYVLFDLGNVDKPEPKIVEIMNPLNELEDFLNGDIIS